MFGTMAGKTRDGEEKRGKEREKSKRTRISSRRARRETERRREEREEPEGNERERKPHARDLAERAEVLAQVVGRRQLVEPADKHGRVVLVGRVLEAAVAEAALGLARDGAHPDRRAGARLDRPPGDRSHAPRAYRVGKDKAARVVCMRACVTHVSIIIGAISRGANDPRARASRS